MEKSINYGRLAKFRRISMHAILEKHGNNPHRRFVKFLNITVFIGEGYYSLYNLESCVYDRVSRSTQTELHEFPKNSIKFFKNSDYLRLKHIRVFRYVIRLRRRRRGICKEI